MTKPKQAPPETDEDLEDDEDEMKYDDEQPLYDPEDVGR